MTPTPIETFWRTRLSLHPDLEQWLHRPAKLAVGGIPQMPASLTLASPPTSRDLYTALADIFPNLSERNGRLVARLDTSTADTTTRCVAIIS